jgi:hypothetical protein
MIGNVENVISSPVMREIIEYAIMCDIQQRHDSTYTVEEILTGHSVLRPPAYRNVATCNTPPIIQNVGQSWSKWN